MAVGDILPAEGRIRRDPFTGATILRDFRYRGLREYSAARPHCIIPGIDTDGGRSDPYLLLWRLRDGRYDGPRRLAWHRGSFHVRTLHVHPRMFPGREGHLRVVYTSDHNGYGNVFLADVPDFESLPETPQR